MVFQGMCVLSCDPSVHLDAPFIGCVCVCRKLSPHFEFALIMLFLFVVLHPMWSGKSLQLLYILPFVILRLSAIRMMFVKIILAVCIMVGIVV